MSEIVNTVKDPRIMTVSEAVQKIDWTVKSMRTLLVEGEISSFNNNRASGHWYFAIKDEEAVLNCMMFASKNYAVTFSPAIGDKVKVGGNLSLYGKTGKLSLEVRRMVRSGQGELFEKFLALKKKLADEGLFQQGLKRPVPLAPRTVGVVTGLQTAALKDVLTRLKRYSPYVDIIVYPTFVQGAAAAEGIVRSLRIASERQEADVLLLVRGGGSIEDLWCFNEEVVARAIRQCSIPVITGIGHDSDQTIADYAADIWAPNPTAAAVAAAAPKEELLLRVEKLCRTLYKDIENFLSRSENQTAYASRLFESPDVFLNYYSDRFKKDLLGFKGSASNFLFASQNNLQKTLHGLGRASFLPQPSEYSSCLIRISNLVNQSLASRERQLKIELPPLDILLAGYQDKLAFLAQGVAKSFQDNRERRSQKLFYEICGFKNKVQFQDRSKELHHLLEKIKVQRERFFIQLKTPALYRLESPQAKIGEDKKETRQYVFALFKGFYREVVFQRQRLLGSLQSLRKQRPVLKNDSIKIAAESMRTYGQMKLTVRRNCLMNLEAKLSGLDPNKMLQLGYAIVKRKNEVVRRGEELQEGQEIQVIFYDRTINARVERITSKNT